MMVKVRPVRGCGGHYGFVVWKAALLRSHSVMYCVNMHMCVRASEYLISAAYLRVKCVHHTAA